MRTSAKRAANMAKATEAQRTTAAPAEGTITASVAPAPSRPSGHGKASKAGGTRAKAAGKAPATTAPTAGKEGGAPGAVVTPRRGRPSKDAQQRDPGYAPPAAAVPTAMGGRRAWA